MAITDFLSTEWDQLTRGVYDAVGNQIGYYVDLPTLASGHIKLYQGQPIGDPWNWNIKNAVGVNINAGKYLIEKGFAPQWMTPQEIDAFRGAMPAPNADVIPALNLPSLTLPDFSFPGLPGVGSVTNLGTLAVWGGLGVVALLILLKPAK